ncbi:single-stranded DNA-binding protein [[Haemophilus] ducreyi]|uniref:Single stranded DNA-binding protein n=2 Tax=Haemophilus ducreyi TaxID=730 RepID=Q7TT99_HAEDU|nr:DNA-binding protein [[Haemophilus] ducreyi]AAP96247.1 putative single stranded DNA-binding protein [[Haemophilus] ducreyi 35000HP]AAP96255.1 hypothetical protein HD_1451 [[Haemophilus] ducreyi 35000HP]AAR87766.1 putative single stranded DNA-binding protein [[Haemophilus] ducreyi]AKO31195.1 single-stranded DNA-binding protein [[Haemophilus] ducreyi]AKO32641.1 single-stranded DNA-binding protein [[Haemophilus] ducreyi]
MRTGFYIVGKLLGQKSTSFTHRETGEVKYKHTIGIQLQDPDGFGGYNTFTQDLRIDERSVNQGLSSSIERLKGKNVMVLVFPREWAMEGGRKGIIYHFDENSVIEEIK